MVWLRAGKNVGWWHLAVDQIDGRMILRPCRRRYLLVQYVPRARLCVVSPTLGFLDVDLEHLWTPMGNGHGWERVGPNIWPEVI
jgi:hypothetical protein